MKLDVPNVVNNDLDAFEAEREKFLKAATVDDRRRAVVTACEFLEEFAQTHNATAHSMTHVNNATSLICGIARDYLK